MHCYCVKRSILISDKIFQIAIFLNTLELYFELFTVNTRSFYYQILGS
jgi:hypothetical protein